MMDTLRSDTLTIKILGRSCCLVDDAFNLAFRVAGDVAKTLLHFAAEILRSADYAIFIHGSAPVV
jgi:hypothetical protein